MEKVMDVKELDKLSNLDNKARIWIVKTGDQNVKKKP